MTLVVVIARESPRSSRAGHRHDQEEPQPDASARMLASGLSEKRAADEPSHPRQGPTSRPEETRARSGRRPLADRENQPTVRRERRSGFAPKIVNCTMPRQHATSGHVARQLDRRVSAGHSMVWTPTAAPRPRGRAIGGDARQAAKNLPGTHVRCSHGPAGQRAGVDRHRSGAPAASMAPERSVSVGPVRVRRPARPEGGRDVQGTAVVAAPRNAAGAVHERAATQTGSTPSPVEDAIPCRGPDAAAGPEARTAGRRGAIGRPAGQHDPPVRGPPLDQPPPPARENEASGPSPEWIARTDMEHDHLSFIGARPGRRSRSATLARGGRIDGHCRTRSSAGSGEAGKGGASTAGEQIQLVLHGMPGVGSPRGRCTTRVYIHARAGGTSLAHPHRRGAWPTSSQPAARPSVKIESPTSNRRRRKIGGPFAESFFDARPPGARGATATTTSSSHGLGATTGRGGRLDEIRQVRRREIGPGASARMTGVVNTTSADQTARRTRRNLQGTNRKSRDGTGYPVARPRGGLRRQK